MINSDVNNSFASNLISLLGKSLKQNDGEIVLNNVLPEIQKQIGGVYVPAVASKLVTLKGSASSTYKTN